MTPTPRVPKCPICGEPAQHETRPFCSRRCRNIDFARWMTGRYAIAGTPEDDPQEGLPDTEKGEENGLGKPVTKGSKDTG